MRIFILEDHSDRIQGIAGKFPNEVLVIWANNAKDAIDILRQFEFDAIFLDHDLAHGPYVAIDDPNSGSQVAKYLAGINYKGQVIIHSWNAGGAENMQKLLPHAKRIPYGQEFKLEYEK